LSGKAIPAIFFEGPGALRAWFEHHHATERELYVGFYKKGAGVTGITYDEAVTQALCFGWIDSTARGIDERTYAQRFTPRKPRSYWSAVNIAKVEALIANGQMHEAGLRSFDERDRDAKPKYSFEQPTDPELEPAMIEHFTAQADAWSYFDRQPPGYKKRIIWWVISAKKPETRRRRLESLIAASAEGKQLG
jgi:uncharacterized protein YdeI (YjbR/CyaY-like superfamily)